MLFDFLLEGALQQLGETRQNTKRGFMQCLCNHRVDPDSPRLAQKLGTYCYCFGAKAMQTSNRDCGVNCWHRYISEMRSLGH